MCMVAWNDYDYLESGFLNSTSNRKLRILDVVFPSSGGIVRERLLLKALSELGHRCFVAELVGKTNLNYKKISVFQSAEVRQKAKRSIEMEKTKGAPSFVFLPKAEQKEFISKLIGLDSSSEEVMKVVNFVETNKIDAVISGDFSVTAPLLKALKEHAAIPAITLSAGYIFTFQKFSDLGIDLQQLRLKYRNLINQLDAIISPSNFDAKRVIEDLCIDQRKVRVVYNGIDLDTPRKLLGELSTDSKLRILKKYNLSYKTYFLYIGRLDVDKGIHIFPFLSKALPNIKIVLAGGEQYDSPCGLDIYKKIIFYYDLKEEKFSIIGRLTEIEKYVIMESAIATVCPSTDAEAFNLVQIESISVNTPVIAPSFGPFPEIAKELSPFIITYHPFDIMDLKRKINHILSTFKRLDYVDNPIRECEFSYKTMALKVLDIILEAGK